MEEKTACHIDCNEFLPIDAFRGFCHIKKTLVATDEEGCEEFTPVQKCGFCKNYAAKEEFEGICMGRIKTYPDLVARKCEDFERGGEG